MGVMQYLSSSNVGRNLYALAAVATLAAGIGLTKEIISPQQAFAQETTQQCERKYETFGHGVLDLEKDFGTTCEDYQVLDEIIDEARERIDFRDSPLNSRADADEAAQQGGMILKTIDKILKEKGFEHDVTRSTGTYFNDSLKSSKKLDCDNYSFIYLSVADALDLPLFTVQAPSHVFVRWHQGTENRGFSFNWETLTASSVGDDHYKSSNITDESVDQGVYLRNLSRDETLSITYSLLVEGYIEKGEFDKAKEAAYKAIELNQLNPTAYLAAGNLMREQGAFDKAQELYDRVIVLDVNCTLAYASKANAYHANDDFENAIVFFDKALELGTRYPGTFDTASAIALMANSMEKVGKPQGEIDKVVSDLESTLQGGDTKGSSFHNAGSLKFDQGDYQGSLDALNKAIELSASPKSYNGRCTTKMELGDLEGALVDCEEAMKLGLDDFNVNYNRCKVLFKLGRNSEAIKYAEKAVSLEPETADAHNLLGVVLHEEGDLEEALKHYQTAVDLGELGIFHYNLSVLHKEMGDLDAAKASLKRAADLDSQYQDVYLRFADGKTRSDNRKTGRYVLGGMFALLLGAGLWAVRRR